MAQGNALGSQTPHTIRSPEGATQLRADHASIAAPLGAPFQGFIRRSASDTQGVALGWS